jgi:hypothetical protein
VLVKEWLRRVGARPEAQEGVSKPQNAPGTEAWHQRISLRISESGGGSRPWFQWQARYGAFSVSQSQRAAVERYIARHEGHHRRFSLQEELRTLLDRHPIAYDERYLWD